MTEKQKSSIDTFFRAEYKKLVNYVRKNMEDRFIDDSPEDIIQDVALSLLARLDVNAQVENLAGYIYRSVKNKIIDTKRKARYSIPIESLTNKQSKYLLTKDIMDEADAEENDLVNFNPELLHNAITQLKPDEQAIIMSTEFENKTFEDLSQKWNIPIGTLLSRKHRALSKLYKLLTKTENIQQTTNRLDYGNKRKVLGKRPVVL
jgi:RNA polymerase sigma-70 factor (ECF subfamily)